jgi:hypothetical protein
MEKYNINNGLIGMNKYTLIKLIEIIAIKEYKKGKKEIEDEEHDEEYVVTDNEGYEYIVNNNWPVPIYVELPENIRNIIGVSKEFYLLKNHKYFREYIRLFNNKDSEFFEDNCHRYRDDDEYVKWQIIEL